MAVWRASEVEVEVEGRAHARDRLRAAQSGRSTDAFQRRARVTQSAHRRASAASPPHLGDTTIAMLSGAFAPRRAATLVARVSRSFARAWSRSHSSSPSSACGVGALEADVLVVGGGHAGCEAAHAAARMGRRTILVTNDARTIGAMSCNPSMGGIGKGTLMREVDSMGGLMGRVADEACIQFRLLNTSKGSAVHGPRMQLDRELYRRAMQRHLRSTPNLQIVEGSVEDLILSSPSSSSPSSSFSSPSSPSRRVCGVVLGDGRSVRSSAVVLTTGTFLRGRLLLGRSITQGGRRSEHGGSDGSHAERPATALAETLQRAGMPLARMRTGTPPRIDRASVDFDRLVAQHSHPVQPFSFLHTPTDGTAYVNPNPLEVCHRTSTTEETRRLVLEAIERGEVPTYESAPTVSRGAASGATQDDSNAPRYCPSLENKFTRFASRSTHSIMLEPEGVASSVIYPQGLEISCSAEYQERVVRSLPGLERAKLLAFGYAVEYDFLDPRGMHPWLESRHLGGLFLAGQINGTTGYEEAAAQGILAGANAALVGCAHAAGSSTRVQPLVLSRGSALVGVLVSDLTRVGAAEPYRMFTSRSEFRLRLRADNADRRLTRVAAEVGLVPADSERLRRLDEKERRLASAALALDAFKQPKSVWRSLESHAASGADLDQLAVLQNVRSSATGISAAAFLEGAPVAITLHHLRRLFPPIARDVHEAIATEAEVEVRYRVHLARQMREVATLERALREQTFIDTATNDDHDLVGITTALPPISSLPASAFSHEDYDRLVSRQPRTLSEARDAGVSPTALARLAQWGRRRQRA